MSAILEQTIYPVIESDWHGLYGESWQGDLVPAAFSHPAKYSRALIRKIYDHAAEEGWIRPGSTIVDPFGGIAGGALDAMLQGCHWKGCELEARFVELGQQNIDLWQSRYSRMPSWGTAELRQGDSRRLSEVIPCGELVVSSPPFVDSLSSGKLSDMLVAELRARGHRPSASGMSAQYGQTAGQLGGMKEGSFDAAISSPPYTQEVLHARPSKMTKELFEGRTANTGLGAYGKTEGQLGAQSGEDFWQASRLILEQLYGVLTPGGHAVFVTKRFVRKKQIVEFSAQWAALCEAVGFRQVCHHRCWLVENHGTFTDLFGVSTELKTERKSFFRRLAEKKGSPRIDYEDALCFVRPA